MDGIPFAAAIFTNLTRDHLDFHVNMEDYFAAKRRLFEMLPADAPALINVDDPRGASLLDVVRRPVSYGINKPADVAWSVVHSLRGLDFVIRARRGGPRPLQAGRETERLQHPRCRWHRARARRSDCGDRGRVATSAGRPGRFEVVSAAADDVTVVVDYAHTDDALRNLLETARPMATSRLITVFGAGGDRDRTKRPLMGMVAARLSDVVVITSDNPRGEDPERIIEEVKRGADAKRARATPPSSRRSIGARRFSRRCAARIPATSC